MSIRSLLGLERTVVDAAARDRTLERFREREIRLPTFGELADPSRIPESVRQRLLAVAPDAPDPLNLYRVHWYNDARRRGQQSVPAHVVLPEALTGVSAPIVVLLGDRFPMIAAHKVLAAYGCLVPRLVTGQFDPTEHRAIWPSTGNYCRGGVAISRILGCRGVAVLPEGMSRERFRWLEDWIDDPADIVRTPGSESNVREIYEKCAELAQDPKNVILNQFCEFGNHLVHRICTGRALLDVFEQLQMTRPELQCRAFVSATGSAGTIGAGDHLKEKTGAMVVAVEALECPTLLHNGFGEHNIQGIGDKHVPLIHNVMGTDVVTAISDAATDSLFLLFNTEAGREFLRQRTGLDDARLDACSHFGFSSICNILAAIKTARAFDFGPSDVILTVATDGAAMYETEKEKILRERFAGNFDALVAAETFGRHLLGVGTDHLLELTHADRRRIFNLGYFTWVEQQGVPVEDFEARRSPSFWEGLTDWVADWDAMIREANEAIES